MLRKVLCLVSCIGKTDVVEPVPMSLAAAATPLEMLAAALRISGFSFAAPACPRCGVEGELDEMYDAFVCRVCMRWLDGPCADPACDVCQGRPARPFKTGRPSKAIEGSRVGEWHCRRSGCPARFAEESRRDAHEAWPHFPCECGRELTRSRLRRHRGQIAGRGLGHRVLSTGGAA